MAGNHEIIGADYAAISLEIGSYLSRVSSGGVIERQDRQARGEVLDFTTGFGRVLGFLGTIEQVV